MTRVGVSGCAGSGANVWVCLSCYILMNEQDRCRLRGIEPCWACRPTTLSLARSVTTQRGPECGLANILLDGVAHATRGVVEPHAAQGRDHHQSPHVRVAGEKVQPVPLVNVHRCRGEIALGLNLTWQVPIERQTRTRVHKRKEKNSSTIPLACGMMYPSERRTRARVHKREEIERESIKTYH